jgi:hypothetical protein
MKQISRLYRAPSVAHLSLVNALPHMSNVTFVALNMSARRDNMIDMPNLELVHYFLPPPHATLIS